ncbi:MAG: MFS transporter [Bacilli bacterium]|jgi:MFS family permease|nr:MFS transporter [Bacilli bacterium]
MKLNAKKTIYVGLAFLIISMFWQVYDNVIAKMLIESYGFDQFWSGVILALDNILALFLLPLFGALSDKTKTKFGKRTPYIFLGVIISAVLFIGIAFIHSFQQEKVNAENFPEIGAITEFGEVVAYEYEGERFIDKMENGKLVLAIDQATEARRLDIWSVSQANIGFLVSFVIVLFFVLLVMSTYRTPAVSLMPDVTPKPLRSKANAIINLMGSAGGVISLIFLMVVGKVKGSGNFATNYIIEFIVLGTLMILFLVFFIIKVKEPKLIAENQALINQYNVEEVETIQEDSSTEMEPAVRRSFFLILFSIVFWFMAYNAATSKFSVYATGVLEMGYETPLLIAQGAAIASYIPIGILASKIGRKKTILMGIIVLFVAFTLGTIATKNTTFLIYITMALAGMGWALINVNSYPMVVEMSKGANIGKYTGYYYTASMAAQIITPMLSGAIMTYLFNNSMRPLFPYCMFFAALAFVTMMMVKHGDSKPIPTKKVEAFASLDD